MWWWAFCGYAWVNYIDVNNIVEQSNIVKTVSVMFTDTGEHHCVATVFFIIFNSLQVLKGQCVGIVYPSEAV